jgi:hypothetical protein
MATRRMIASDIFEDEFFTSLTHFQRLIWLGLIISCADDQGRMQDNAALVRARLCPQEDVSVDQIEEILFYFCQKRKILRYQIEDRKCIQLINWQKYQKIQYSHPSKYPAPKGWSDRAHYED